MFTRSIAIVAAVCVFFSICESTATAETPQERLEEDSQLECKDLSLKLVAVYFSKLHSVEIEIADGVNVNVPVTIKTKGKLKDVLKEVLKPMKLEYSVDSDRILIQPKQKSGGSIRSTSAHGLISQQCTF